MSPLLALVLLVSPPTQAPPEIIVDGGAPQLAPPPAPVRTLPDAGPEGGIGPLPTFIAVHVDAPPKIDGKLADAAWLSAPPIDNFTQSAPRPGRPASMKTVIKFAYDAKNLYVAFHCFDPIPARVSNRLTRRDRVIESDSVSLEIDARGDKRSAFGFSVYPTNVQLDWLRTGDFAQDYDFDAVWRSATRRTADGWTAELAIPFSILRFKAGPEVRFRVEAVRYVSRLGETDQLVFQPPDQQGALLRMAELAGLRDLRPGGGVELRPFVLGSFDHRSSPGPGYDPPSGNSFTPSAGLDLTWRPRGQLTLDATVLPDFGQVEADQVVLNLSTFETFFPEKRPFFLSGADLFALHDDLGNTTNTQVFYSRRVGRPPPYPQLASGQTLVEQPLTNDIWGALKLTGKASDHVTVALLDGVARREYATVQSPDGTQAQLPVAPLSNYAVARVRGELGAGFTLGATVTGVTRRDIGLAEPLGCPTDPEAENVTMPSPTGRCTADAYTGGVDATWSSPAGRYVAMASLLGSLRAQGPDEAIPDGTVIRAGDTGLGGMAQFAKAGGNWLYSASYEGYSSKLDLNEVGYLRQQNLHQLQLTGDYRTTEPFGATLNTDSELFVVGRESTDGIDLGRHFQLSESVGWKNFWGSYFELDLDPSYQDNRELRDGSIYQRPASYGGFVQVHSDARKAVSFNAWLWLGNTWQGYSSAAQLEVDWHPLDRLELSLIPQLNWSDGDPRWFATDGAAPGPRTYHFGNLDARATSATFRGTYTFSPTLTLQAYAQLFVAIGHYGPFFDTGVGPGRAEVQLGDLSPAGAPADSPDFKDGNLNLNVVLRWEYLPGSVLFLVYTRAQTQGDLTPGLSPIRPDFAALARGPYDDVFLLKISYDFST